MRADIRVQVLPRDTAGKPGCLSSHSAYPRRGFERLL
jgi:hypothetical protein